MTCPTRLNSAENWSDDMSESKHKQGLMLLVAIVGFACATLITYHRMANDDMDAPSAPPKDWYAATSANVDNGAYRPKTVVRPFRPIKNAPFIKASEVKNQVADNELVLAIEIEGQARAYPINMLCGPQREIINDNVGNRAIAATW